jgi:hypothetical protein
MNPCRTQIYRPKVSTVHSHQIPQLNRTVFHWIPHFLKQFAKPKFRITHYFVVNNREQVKRKLIMFLHKNKPRIIDSSTTSQTGRLTFHENFIHVTPQIIDTVYNKHACTPTCATHMQLCTQCHIQPYCCQWQQFSMRALNSEIHFQKLLQQQQSLSTLVTKQ